MSLLELPRCPNCNSEVDLKELWRAAPKSGRGSQLAGKIGVVCPVCGIKLRVLDGRARILSVGLFIVMVCSAAAVGKMSKSYGNDRTVLVVFGILCIAGYIFFQKSFSRLLQLRILEEGETAGFPLITLAEDLATWRAAADSERVNLEPVGNTGPGWTCGKCHEENPGNFDICWKCQAERPAEVKTVPAQ
jgi:hypothetical protein